MHMKTKGDTAIPHTTKSGNTLVIVDIYNRINAEKTDSIVIPINGINPFPSTISVILNRSGRLSLLWAIYFEMDINNTSSISVMNTAIFISKNPMSGREKSTIIPPKKNRAMFRI